MTAPANARSGAFFDLSARTKLRVSGNDRLRFLNGQVTNHIGKATSNVAIPACVLNVKGRIDAHVFVSTVDDALFIDSDPEVREKLPARLERYIIADDVQVEDVSSEWSIFHVLSFSVSVSVPGECRILSADRFHEPGWDVWIKAAEHDKFFNELSEAFFFCDAAAAEVFRIEQGVPRWGRELTDEINPIEANLEESCVDYQKGCYIGQEVISRMKMSGQRNKKLCGFVSVHESPMERGMRLFPIGEEKKETGWITSAVRSKRLDKEIALGYIKRPFPPSTGFRLDALDEDNPYRVPAVRVQTVDLPFVR
jgi:tRNA-modifying protein YgfZ